MSKTNKELTVTQKEYDEAMKKGWGEDDIQKPGKHRFRRVSRIAKAEDILPSNIKVQLTLRIDLDILEHFKKRASAPNAAPYQTQINAELRRIMAQDLNNAASDIKTDIKTLSSDPDFIRAVALQLKELETIQ